MTVNGQPLQMTMHGQKTGKIANAPYLLVLNDKQYQELASMVPDELKLVSYGFELKEWEKAGPTIERINKLVSSEQLYSFVSRTTEYTAFRQVGSLVFLLPSLSAYCSLSLQVACSSSSCSLNWRRTRRSYTRFAA